MGDLSIRTGGNYKPRFLADVCGRICCEGMQQLEEAGGLARLGLVPGAHRYQGNAPMTPWYRAKPPIRRHRRRRLQECDLIPTSRAVSKRAQFKFH
ncbi:hypothetical protein TcasGA2_TC014765 [Tribolium castaneum]|uniref:Uncharacterized protein n=1 Tax=Tribolium castaneum TaxID=7070 RepID=D6WJM0_TRICA|nr:hypothetical protein TcasGA2_TC014765 [Tribolium castaneum]